MLFLRVCQVFGMYLPCSAKVEHCWLCAHSSPVCRGTGGRCLFSGVSAQPLGTYSLEPPVPACPVSLGLLSWAFQIIFITSCVLYQLQHRVMTHSEPDDIACRWQLNGDLFFYDCSLWLFMAGQTICLLLQHLMEAAAIICEGSAIFSKSQNKTQPWWGVLGCFLFINPQLLAFKVSWVFHASEMVILPSDWVAMLPRHIKSLDFTAYISSVWKHLNCGLHHCLCD